MTLLDCFAASLALSGDIKRAAASLGKSEGWGRSQFRALCDELGLPAHASDEKPSDWRKRVRLDG
jgi:hypothetical protein